MTIFGPALHDLTIGDLQRFLGDAKPEALLWEAKGIEANAGTVRKQVCGFANSHNGGYLIIGADESGGSWTFDGVAFPEEPPTWISNIVGNRGVNPYPDGLDTQPIPTSDGRHVAVVRIPPVATPPCNAHGTVYERVSGRTISVREPLRLAELFARGDQAKKDAEAKAHTAAREIMAGGRDRKHFQPSRVQFGLGLTAAGYLPDISSRLFSIAFEERVVSCLAALPHGPDLAGPPRGQRFWTQDSRLFVSEGRDDVLGRSWLVRTTWDGAVGMYWVHGHAQGAIDRLFDPNDSPVDQAWVAAEEVLGILQPQGPRYLQLMVAGGEFRPNIDAQGQVLTVVGRGPIDPGVDPAVLDGMKRELQRATGQMAYETPDGI
jgi:hypothetical protein